MSDAVLVAAENIGLRLGEHLVLSDVSVTVHGGEIVSLIGPNGAGKTTLIRVVLGLQSADTGTVVRRAGLRIGYMPQSLAIDETLPLTVDRFLRLKSRVGADALGRALGDVGAGQLGRSQMRDLSGGELRRVLLARALLGEPELLVLDEPVQGVDVAGQSDLYALITQVRDRLGCGILMVSHDLHVVMAATDRVICLNRHVCCAGRPEAVSRHPEYQALFGPAVARRFAVYTHAHDHRHDAHGDVLPLRAGPAPEKRAAGAEPEEARSEK